MNIFSLDEVKRERDFYKRRGMPYPKILPSKYTEDNGLSLLSMFLAAINKLQVY